MDDSAKIPIYAQYESLTDETPKSIAWASTGGDGSGKSHFGLTAPGPIFVCGFDPYGMNRVSPEVKRDKDIKIARYPFDPQGYKSPLDCSKAALVVWEKFRTDYALALSNARTILIDREDLMYELQRYAKLGGLGGAPKEYGPLYIEYAWLIQKAQAMGVNLGVLRGIRDQWVSKFDPQKQKLVPHNTGVKIPDGMNKIPDYVDITLAHRWDAVQKSFVVKIEKFTNPTEREAEYSDLTFPQMGMLAYPETTEEDWQ